MILVSLADGSPIVLNKAVIFFGRSHECDIILAQSRKVSRKHCCLAQIDDTYFVRDLGSMNGVRVNQRKADPELQVEVGDEIWVGDVGYRLQPANSNGAKPAADSAAETPPKKKMVNSVQASFDKPVAIPEEGQELIIEDSIRKKILDDED